MSATNSPSSLESDPAVDAELRKFAHTLGLDPTDPEAVAPLQFLSAVPADQLRTLRRQAADALFEVDRPIFAKIAALTRTVPVQLSAKLAEAALTPLLAARTAELLDAAKATELAARLSDRYLADVAASLDAARAPALIGALEPPRIARIARELVARREWVVIAGFIGHVDDAALDAALGELDGAALLRVAFVVDDLDRLGVVASRYSEAQSDAMLAAAIEDSLWAELTFLLRAVPADERERLAARYAVAPESVRRSVVDAGEPAAAALALLGG